MQPVYILLTALGTVLAAMAAGKLLLRLLGVRLTRLEDHLYAFLAGSACLSTLVFLIAAAQVLRRGVLLALGLALIAAALWRRAWRAPEPQQPALPVWWRWLFGAVFGVFTVVYFFNAMAPEVSADGVTYHLGLVDRYLRESGFRRLTDHMYANLSQGIEMLFLFAYAFGKHSAAAMIHFAFLVALPLQMLAWARRNDMATAGAAAALFFYASPVVGLDGISAYNDVATASIIFGVFALLDIWDRERQPGLLVLAGLLAGFGYAAKYTAFLAVPYALVFVALKLCPRPDGRGYRSLRWWGWRARQPWLKPVFVVGTCAALMIVPWVAKNLIVLGNPFSPFLNRWFPNPYTTVAFEEDYLANMRHYGGLEDYREIPLEVTVRGQVLTGLLGPLFLLTPLALAALRKPAGRRLWLAALIFALPYANNIGTRFLIPALPFLSLALAMTFARWQPLLAALVAIHAVLSWPTVIPTYSAPHAWRLTGIPWKAALRLEPEERYQERFNPRYFVARMIEEKVPPGRNVFSQEQVPEAFTRRNILVHYQSAANHVLADILFTPVTPDYQPTWRHTFRFPSEPLRKVRVVQTASGVKADWSVSEMRLWKGAEELPRRGQWRLRAHPNPWDVQLAFDNSPVTRWKSWHKLFDGMYLEVDLGVPAELDQVTLDCARDQYPIRMRLEGQDAAGAWRVMAETSEESQVAASAGLRRAAVDELKLRGVDYLLFYENNYGDADIRAKAPLWGLTLVGETHGARLYRLD